MYQGGPSSHANLDAVFPDNKGINPFQSDTMLLTHCITAETSVEAIQKTGNSSYHIIFMPLFNDHTRDSVPPHARRALCGYF